MQARVVVVIPMFGKAEYTRECVRLTKLNYGTGEPIEILVVDDGSSEPFVDPTINVIRLEKNSGFTAASNAGILWAQYRNADYVLLLNNDTEPEFGFLQELLVVMESDSTIGIAASVRVHPDREGHKYELCGSDIIRGYQHFTDLKSIDGAPEVLDANWIPLCSGFLRMDMIREIGLLDKRFRNHCSDSEMCLRAKFNYWKVMLATKSRVVHHLSVTTTANGVVVDDDQRIFLEKLAGLETQKLLAAMPLDGEAGTYGRLSFEVYKK